MTFRSMLLGIISVIALAYLVSYIDLGLNIGWIGGAHLPAGAMGVLLFLVLGINALLRVVARRFAFTRAEILTAYCMMIVGCLIPSFGLTSQLLPNLAGINYFATPENHWADTFFPHIKPWLVPFDPTRHLTSPVVRTFYEGLHPGKPIPWGAWITPLASWTLFAFLLFFAQLFLASLLRKQWVDNEKLIFPLVQLPVELCKEESSNATWPPFFHNRLMWLGFLLPALVHGLNGLHIYYPFLPQVKMQVPLNPIFATKPWSDMGFTTIFLSFSVIGFSYLVPLDIAFSFWFFFLLSRLQGVAASAVGMQLTPMPLFPGYTFTGYQSAGSCVAIAVGMAWTGRHHLGAVWRDVIASSRARNSSSGFENDGSNEPLPHHLSLLGLIVSLLLMIVWLACAGMTWPVAAFVVFSLMFFLILVMARCVNAAGLLMVQALFRPTDLVAMFAPRAALGAGNLTVLCFLDTIFIRDLRGCLMPAFMDSFKIADLAAINRRRLVGALVIAMVVSTVASYWVSMNLIYHQGGLKLSGWFLQANPQISWKQTQAVLEQKAGAEIQNLGFFVVGVGSTLFLIFMRSKFFWWPFHPIGYAMGASWSLIVYWFAFFIGWLCKAIILRYGGSRLFLQLRPFFLGLALGEFAMTILWALISAMTRKPMPPIFVS